MSSQHVLGQQLCHIPAPPSQGTRDKHTLIFKAGLVPPAGRPLVLQLFPKQAELVWSVQSPELPKLGWRVVDAALPR